MTKIILWFAVVIAFACGQEKSALPAEVEIALKAIEAQDMIGNARTLSSPEYEGREPATPGSINAGNFVAEQFRAAKLLPGGDAGSYFSYFKMSSDYDISTTMSVQYNRQQKRLLSFSKHFTLLYAPKEQISIHTSFAFVGYGITCEAIGFDEYKNINVKDRIAVVFSGVPWGREATLWLSKVPEAKNFDSLSYKVDNAVKHGAKAVFIVDNPIGWRDEIYVDRLKSPGVFSPLDVDIPVVHITHECLSILTRLKDKELQALAISISKDTAPESIPFYERKIHLQVNVENAVMGGRNIIGVLPGSDPDLRKEAVVIGAHYDHLGKQDNDIYCGANDNSSGTSAVIAIAHAFGHLVTPPRRTIVFVAFDAEECGLQGSEFYVKNPAIAMKDTVFMINFDMIGRNEANQIYAVGTRSNTILHKVHHEMNAHVGLEIKNPDNFRLGLSDHSSFYYANVPIMYLFGGLDIDYHTPQDTWEKLLPRKMQQAARLAFLTAWHIANLDKRIEFMK